MNLICSDLKLRLSVSNISSFMFININGLPVTKWNPTYYIRSWLFKHRFSNYNRSRKVAQTKFNEEKGKCYNLLI